MKFLCDDNLGKLARYLRMLGYDTAFDSAISDARLLAEMLKENRFVLTRDNYLAKRIEPERHMLITDNNPERQLQMVIEKLGLIIDKKGLFTICLECNRTCRQVTADDVADKVFPYTVKTQDKFTECPDCGRIYWRGSHYEDMIKKLQSILGTAGF